MEQANKPLGKQIAQFKKLARQVVRGAEDDLTRICFTHDEQNTRLSGLGILGNQSAARVILYLTDEMWTKVFLAIFVSKPAITITTRKPPKHFLPIKKIRKL